MHYAEGSIMPSVVLRLLFVSLPKQPMPAIARPVVRQLAKGVVESFVQPQIKLHFDYVEQALAQHTWFAGDDFTAADIQMSFPIEAMAPVIDKTHRKLTDYLARIRERPGYRRALARGGPHDPARLEQA
jgi:glutathione S-transferase